MEIRPDLSICLLPEQDGADLGPCLAALFACADPLSLEIFVPLGSHCGGVQDSSRLHFLDLPAHPAPSFVKEVWHHARGRYLGLWHGGVLASPATLFTLVEFLDDHPDVAVAGPRFFNERGDILATAFGKRTLLPSADPVMPGWDGLATMAVDWLSGAALVMSGLALADIDLPGGALGGIWERRLCQRLQRQGWHSFFVHLARAVSRDRFCEPATLWQRLNDDWRQVKARLAIGSFSDK